MDSFLPAEEAVCAQADRLHLSHAVSAGCHKDCQHQVGNYIW